MQPWMAERINQQHIAETRREAQLSALSGGSRQFPAGRINPRLLWRRASAVSAARARVTSCC
jgi:hypothetical protein